MATIQVRVDDITKAEADQLFSALGLDTSTAVRIFLKASLENGGLPFPVKRLAPRLDLMEAIEDTRLHRNLYGPYMTAAETMAPMLED